MDHLAKENQEGSTENLPILFDAKNQIDDIIEGSNRADDYITNAFCMEELRLRIKQSWEEPRKSDEVTAWRLQFRRFHAALRWASAKAQMEAEAYLKRE